MNTKIGTFCSFTRSQGRSWNRGGLSATVTLLLLLVVSSHGAAAEVGLKVEVHGQGRPMILIPGLSCGGDVWDGTVESLRGEFEIHVVTLPGFAGTDALAEGEPFLTTVHSLLVSYIEHQEMKRPILVGHSLGAHLAYLVASQSPQLAGPVIAVDGLPFLGALQNPEATSETMAPVAEQVAAMFREMNREQFAMQNQMALRSMIRDPEMIEWVAVSSGRSDTLTVGRAMAELMVSDLREDLSKIEAPILQLGAFGGLPTEGMRSNMAARYQEQIAKAPDARFVEAPTLHFVMLDDPEFFIGAVRGFLQEVN